MLIKLPDGNWIDPGEVLAVSLVASSESNKQFTIQIEMKLDNMKIRIDGEGDGREARSMIDDIAGRINAEELPSSQGACR